MAQDFLRRAVEIWISGGWAMLGIAAIAMAMFTLGMHIHLGLSAKGFVGVSERVWRGWIKNPGLRTGPIGELLDFVTQGRTLEETTHLFDELRASETVPFERDLRVMKVCVGAAPLVGLLGTVIGMLATFGALATGSGGDKTMSMIASGISEALITTETGLVIALPGLFFQYQLARKHERYKAFLAHLETVYTQTIYHRAREEERETLRRTARVRIAHELRDRLRGAPGASISSSSPGAPGKDASTRAPRPDLESTFPTP